MAVSKGSPDSRVLIGGFRKLEDWIRQSLQIVFSYIGKQASEHDERNISVGFMSIDVFFHNGCFCMNHKV